MPRPTELLNVIVPGRRGSAAVLTALALGLVLAPMGCGGSSDPIPPAAPGDTTAPTVVITDGASGTATGPVTFTFTFSEPIDATFSVAKIGVSGGTAGAFTRTSPTVSTLVVVPPSGQKGTIQVALAAGAFRDAAGNLSTSAASRTQDFDTELPSLSITDDVASGDARGPVTFTFTFSEAIDASFDASKIAATGGAPGTFTRVSSTVSTLVVVPPVGQTGTMGVSVAPGAFRDVAGNASATAVSGSQTFNTITAPAAPTVTISDSVATGDARGPVTFTFTFSEAIDATFNASKVTVSGGSAGTFARVSPTVSTLVVVPPATGSGVLSVTVPAGAFRSLSGTANTAPASASQTYANAVSYKDSSLSPEVRLADLLPRMTLDEKIGQMAQVERASLASPSDIATYGLGSILSGGGSAPSPNTPAAWAAMVDGFQQQAMGTRLGIPMIYGVDAVHGHNNAYGAVLFPHNIGLGAANDADLVKRIGQATAAELKATGVHWTFAPCVAVPRDERWGRTYEGFAEIPSIASTLGAAYITGLQGPQIGAGSVIGCAKHFLADGGTSGGVDQGNAVINQDELYALHLPPYRAAVDAGVGTVMASFSSWNGVKMHGNKVLMTDLLKGTLGFDGFIVSDWAGVTQLPGSGAEQLVMAINAGMDMVMLPYDYVTFASTMKTLVGQGTIPLSRIDDAVSRILRVKFRMGLFDHPYSDPSLRGDFGTTAHRAIGREAVAKSAVLLKNETATLPIRQANVHAIHVAGWKADDIGIQCGGWSITWQGGVGAITPGTTLREAIEAAAATRGITVSYSADGALPPGAATPDLVIAAIGETAYAEGAGDSSSLALPGEDATLFSQATSFGKPVVTVLFSGRPVMINDYLAGSSALLAAWWPGTEAGGLADVLFGATSPTGKLPHTWPANLAQVPINGGDGKTALFPFGAGLTY